MNKEQFEKYFWKIMDRDLANSLDTWQVTRIKIMVLKGFNKGKVKIKN